MSKRSVCASTDVEKETNGPRDLYLHAEHAPLYPQGKHTYFESGCCLSKDLHAGLTVVSETAQICTAKTHLSMFDEPILYAGLIFEDRTR